MKIDWSKAPEGATHYYKGSPQPWRDLSGYNWKYFMNGEWHLCPSCCTSAELMRELDRVLFALPPSQAWNGEGLPPVGKSVCEYLGAKQYDEWTVVSIFAHYGNIVFVDYGDGWRDERDISRFRPISPAEQVAEEERLAGIAEIQRIVEAGFSSGSSSSASLWDAGYRKQVAQ